jgi:hypothetical protein
VANLLPDSTTLQNVWSYAPGTASGWFGVGLNASVTMLDRSMASGLIRSGGSAFGGGNTDLMNLSDGIPFLPAASFDLRAGGGRFDFGISGMWLTPDFFPEYTSVLLGQDSNFEYMTVGVDARYALIKDKQFFGFMPSVTVIGGYYFSYMKFGFDTGSAEKAEIQFRNDSFLFAVQISKELPIIKPFIGGKAIFSRTDHAYMWETERPVTFRGENYHAGVKYESGAIDGEMLTYFQVYGGLGFTILFKHVLTASVAYNVITQHFCVNLAARLIFG